VHLDAATRERLGVQVLPLAAVELPEEVRGFGRVLDPGALAAPLYDRDAAHAAFDAADREHHRVETLQRGNANSRRDLEAARAAVERERARLERAENRLISAWGRAGAGREDLPALVRSLVARESSLARIDVPLGGEVPGAAATARVARTEASDSGVAAQLLGPAPDVDPTTQGRGVLLLIERPWPPGTALVGWITLAGSSRTGVEVPRSALVREGGKAYAYVNTGEDAFARRALVLERPIGDGWFVSGGLTAGERVVVAGAQQLLAAELARSNPEPAED
jgi:hypothetical protein